MGERMKLAIVYGIIAFIFYTNTTVQQRHDGFKALMGPIDDVVVAKGYISDKHLHYVGGLLGLCKVVK